MIERRKIIVRDDHILVPLHGRKQFYGWAMVDLSDFLEVSKTCWTLTQTGYAVGRPPGSRNALSLHRFLMIGVDRGGLIDHRNGIKLDCRRANLRHATMAGNAQNKSIGKNNSAGFKGIRLTARGKWNARITVGWKEIHIGNYATKEEAAMAYDLAAAEYHGEFAKPNSATLT